MTREATRNYSNGEVTVIWRAELCVHSGICFTGLPQVFAPQRRPWVDVNAAPSEAIVAQVRRCPSGALSFRHDQATDAAPSAPPAVSPSPPPSDTDPGAGLSQAVRIEIRPNGPLVVYGRLRIKNSAGEEIERESITSFCRCGGSSNKPFCDGTHRRNGFLG